MKVFLSIIAITGLCVGGYYVHENYRPAIDPAYAVEAYLNAVDRTEEIAADLADRQADMEARAMAGRSIDRPLERADTSRGTVSNEVDPYGRWHTILHDAEQKLAQDTPEWKPTGEFANLRKTPERSVPLTALAPVKSERERSIFEGSRRFRVLGSTYDGRRRRIRHARTRRGYPLR